MEALRASLIAARASVAALVVTACAPPAVPPACQASTNCGALGEVTVCCTLSSCEYRVASGTVFPCAGTDCTAAHLALAEYCAPHCPDAAGLDASATLDDGADVSLDTGSILDAQPCVR